VKLFDGAVLSILNALYLDIKLLKAFCKFFLLLYEFFHITG